MHKYVSANVCGNEWKMPVSYGASREIAQRVGDPLQMAIAAHQTGALNMTIEQVIDTLSIGVRLAGSALSREQVAEHVFEQGVTEYLGVVGQYISAMVSGTSEKQGAAAKK